MSVSETSPVPFIYQPTIWDELPKLELNLFKTCSTVDHSYWERLKNYMQGITPLSRAIEALNPNNLSENDFQNIFLACHFLCHNHNSCGKRIKIHLQKLIAEMPSIDQEKILTYLAHASVDKDSPKLLEVALELFSLEQLRGLAHAKMEGETIEDVIKNRAEHLASWSKSDVLTTPSEIQRHFSIIQRFLFQLFRLIEIVFGHKDGVPRQNEFDIIRKIELYLKIVFFPATLLAYLHPFFSSMLTASLVAGTILFGGAAFIYSYLRWLKPCTDALPEHRNLTMEVLSGMHHSAIVRTKQIEKLVAHVKACLKNDQKIHILIIGEPGSGKTQAVIALAKLLVEEKSKIQAVFSTNASNLLKTGFNNSNESLQNTLKEIEGFEERVILALDEFHAIIKPESTLPDLFKTTLLSREQNAIHTIGMTTIDDYKKYIQPDRALDQRLFTIEFPSVLDDDTLTDILTNYANNHGGENPKIRVAKKAILKTIEKTNSMSDTCAQPGRAITVLENALREIREMHSGFDLELKNNETKLDRLNKAFHTNPHKFDINTDAGKQAKEAKEALEKTVSQQKQKSSEIREKLEKLDRLRARRAELNHLSWKWVEMIAKNQQVEESKKRIIVAKFFTDVAFKTIRKAVEQTFPLDYPIKVTEEFVQKIPVST